MIVVAVGVFIALGLPMSGGAFGLPRDAIVVRSRLRVASGITRGAQRWDDVGGNPGEDEKVTNYSSLTSPVLNVTLASRGRFPLLYTMVENRQNGALDVKRTTTPEESTLYASLPSRLSNLTVNLLATAGCASLLTQGLMQWEWFQTLRYAWPFALGGLFLLLGVRQEWRQSDAKSSCYEDEKSMLSIFQIVSGDDEESRWLPWSVSAAGTALILGGAADAWLPVYVTGPNLVTAAGLGPDAAAYLLGVTLWRASTTKRTEKVDLSTIVLMAQLYILGAGSLDDVVSHTAAALMPSG